MLRMRVADRARDTDWGNHSGQQITTVEWSSDRKLVRFVVYYLVAG